MAKSRSSEKRQQHPVYYYAATGLCVAVALAARTVVDLRRRLAAKSEQEQQCFREWVAGGSIRL